VKAKPILVTAFGPFGGREVNASSMALHELRRSVAGIRWRVLPVDLVDAPRRLHEAVKRISPSAIVMLGEAGNAARIRIEMRAWNEIDFPIPDIRGRHPATGLIDRAGPPFLETRVEAARLVARLGRTGHDAELSTDPGRYLCNRLYHAALSRWPVPAVFVHLPLESVLEIPRAAAAVSEVIAGLVTLPPVPRRRRSDRTS
jgi:pyroglutamyl-peptidase